MMCSLPQGSDQVPEGPAEVLRFPVVLCACMSLLPYYFHKNTSLSGTVSPSLEGLAFQNKGAMVPIGIAHMCDPSSV